MYTLNILFASETVNDFEILEYAVITADEIDLPKLVLLGHETKMRNANLFSKYYLEFVSLSKGDIMADNNTVIAISAFSGLAGAILAQAISGTITYFSDKRKVNNEVKAAYRNKKMEIGENFYYVTSEKVSIIRSHIYYWKKREFIESETALAFLNSEMKKLGEQQDRLNADGWRFNLINLYFRVSLSSNTLTESNATSQRYYLQFLDAIDSLKKASEEEKFEELQARYAMILFDMCSHYEDLCKQMERDMDVVKQELLSEFSLTLD